MKLGIDKVYNMDCLELMREMVRGGVRCQWAICDVPYGIGVGSMTYTNGVKMAGKALANRRDYSSQSGWDGKRLTKEYFDLMFQISENQIIWGGNYYSDILPPTKSWIVWDKRCDEKYRNAFGDCELAWCSKGVARVFRYLYNGMLQGDMRNKDVRFHATQKPTQIMYQLINYYTKPGDLIFDGFMGSFTTAVACHKTGRHFIGAEADEYYFKKGYERYRAETAQMSIFDIIDN